MDNEILLKLYSLYQKELYLYLYSLCGDRHLAEDLLHETFLKALLALQDGHTNIRAWLYMVARNLFYNQQKKKSREILMDQQEYLSAEKTDEDLLEKIFEEENRRMLYQAIRRLEIKKREIIQMQYFGGMSQKEIAAVLHITPENVRVLAYRAKKELKKYLEKEGIK
nr:RNA polymerase sigma factor [uncultured Blautia sp.]